MEDLQGGFKGGGYGVVKKLLKRYSFFNPILFYSQNQGRFSPLIDK